MKIESADTQQKGEAFQLQVFNKERKQKAAVSATLIESTKETPKPEEGSEKGRKVNLEA